MVRRNRISNQNEICRICGASARYSYYGAIVCHSCKMFFRRHAENENVSALYSNKTCFLLLLTIIFHVSFKRKFTSVFGMVIVKLMLKIVAHVHHVDLKNVLLTECQQK